MRSGARRHLPSRASCTPCVLFCAHLHTDRLCEYQQQQQYNHSSCVGAGHLRCSHVAAEQRLGRSIFSIGTSTSLSQPPLLFLAISPSSGVKSCIHGQAHMQCCVYGHAHVASPLCRRCILTSLHECRWAGSGAKGSCCVFVCFGSLHCCARVSVRRERTVPGQTQHSRLDACAHRFSKPSSSDRFSCSKILHSCVKHSCGVRGTDEVVCRCNLGEKAPQHWASCTSQSAARVAIEALSGHGTRGVRRGLDEGKARGAAG